MRGRPLGPVTTSAAIPTRLRHAALRSAACCNALRSAAGNRNGPTARGSTRSAASPDRSTVRDRAVSTDSGSTIADAWGGSAGGAGREAESASGRRCSVVSAIRRPDCRARSRTVSSTPSQVGWPAA